MGRIIVGFVIGVLVVVVSAFCYVRFGFVDPRADAEIGALESKIAMPALDAAVDRLAPDTKNPLQPTDDTLMAGMKTYQSDCAGCHGDVQHARVAFGDAFYPRAPQFAEDAPDMPENQNFYIIQHGVRLSGMPAWGKMLNEQQIWQLTTFMSHMDKLPPAVASAWKTAANVPEAGASSDSGSQTQPKEKKSADMPMR
jgi:mono/diheme cytochrome c family protein